MGMLRAGQAGPKPAVGATSACSLHEVPPRVQGSARVIRCLQDAREELGYTCSATLFNQEVRMAEDIDFKYPMKRACTAEITKFCANVDHSHANIIRCLQASPCAAATHNGAAGPAAAGELSRGKQGVPPARSLLASAATWQCWTAGCRTAAAATQPAHAHAHAPAQEHVDEEDMSAECREEVVADQIRSNQDFRCACTCRLRLGGDLLWTVRPVLSCPAWQALSSLAAWRGCAPARAQLQSAHLIWPRAQAQLPPGHGVRRRHPGAVHRGVRGREQPGLWGPRAALPD